MTAHSLDVDRLLTTQLSRPRLIGLLALGAAGLVQGTLVTALLLTEPQPLPLRTTVALTSVATAGFAWALFAGWRLTRRVPLLLWDRVVSSGMATLFTAVAVIGGTWIAIARDEPGIAVTIGCLGAVALTGGILLLRRSVMAHRRARVLLSQLQSGEHAARRS
ncbi:hypothetical protein [Euzebya tangerina]|uniref:hypothetical protein n=1 Tax=Euzebya tangerina TaxID=591198 RepID=UPI000E31F91B|nr:hypothetical protein [Euzebya tangerina]